MNLSNLSFFSQNSSTLTFHEDSSPNLIVEPNASSQIAPFKSFLSNPTRPSSPSRETRVNPFGNMGTITFWNLHGFSNFNNLPRDDIQNLFDKCMIFCFTESWISQKISQIPRFAAKFQLFDVPAKKNKVRGRASGGIGIFIDPDKFKNPTVCETQDSFIAISGFINGLECLIINVYLSPSDTEADFHNELTTLSTFLRRKFEKFHGTVIIGGDFNARIGFANQVAEETLQDSPFSYTRNSKDKTLNKHGSLNFWKNSKTWVS
ncbi:hypothetical protein QAD02_002711 [Eretmocerus hayati]|uniref:Uncharacterized protein n=1 Tax=Eretmocerus hayati TaxID=131215 RepID=A0ACC2NK28_9HYME|nr:hypothetical protein QAD02_002711 [Eretmocerus hayati]